jgi:hypothetical protein
MFEMKRVQSIVVSPKTVLSRLLPPVAGELPGERIFNSLPDQLNRFKHDQKLERHAPGRAFGHITRGSILKNAMVKKSHKPAPR